MESRGFDATYYRQWKSNFSEKEWEQELQKLIAEVYIEAEVNEKAKKVMWLNSKGCIFNKLSPIFIEEQMWNKLLEIYPIKSGFRENLKFTTTKSPFLLWGKGFRDRGLTKTNLF